MYDFHDFKLMPQCKWDMCSSGNLGISAVYNGNSVQTFQHNFSHLQGSSSLLFHTWTTFLASPMLFYNLQSTTNFCGTVTPNRKRMLKTSGQKMKQKQGDIKTRVKGNLTATVCKDKWEIHSVQKKSRSLTIRTSHSIIIRVVLLSSYLCICGVSLFFIHYNQSCHVYINQRHQYICLIWS